MSNIFVFDTNCLVSATLLKKSINVQAIDKAILTGKIAISQYTMFEFTEVIFRQKFDRYFVDDSERLGLIAKIEQNVLTFKPKIRVSDCRDPKDNMFLELAISAKASCIVSGDPDLLVLHPFRNIPILTAADFLKQF